MNTNTDLENIAVKHHILLNDVFMKDEPPQQIFYGGYIINLQDAELNKGGTHWVAVYVPPHEKKIAYFDSFGFPPPQSVINWIKSTGLRNYKIAFNTKQIQNINSGGCGIYCLFFIDFMGKKHKTDIEDDIHEFGELFDDDTTKNLTLLKKYVPYYHNS